MKTNNLDLNAYAVEELNEVETLEMEGGNPWIVGIVGAFIYDALSSLDKNIEAFKKGYDSVK